MRWRGRRRHWRRRRRRRRRQGARRVVTGGRRKRRQEARKARKVVTRRRRRRSERRRRRRRKRERPLPPLPGAGLSVVCVGGFKRRCESVQCWTRAGKRVPVTDKIRFAWVCVWCMGARVAVNTPV